MPWEGTTRRTLVLGVNELESSQKLVCLLQDHSCGATPLFSKVEVTFNPKTERNIATSGVVSILWFSGVSGQLCEHAKSLSCCTPTLAWSVGGMGRKAKQNEMKSLASSTSRH